MYVQQMLSISSCLVTQFSRHKKDEREGISYLFVLQLLWTHLYIIYLYLMSCSEVNEDSHAFFSAKLDLYCNFC